MKKRLLIIVIILLPFISKAQLITKFPIYDTLVTQIPDSLTVTNKIEIYTATSYTSGIDTAGIIYAGLVNFDGGKGVVRIGKYIWFPSWHLVDKSLVGKITMAN